MACGTAGKLMKRREVARVLVASASAAALTAGESAAQPEFRPVFEASDAEVNVGITPADRAFSSGPRRYGARGDAKTDDTDAWRRMGRVGGCHSVPDGVYRITAKIQTSSFLSIVGATRQNTILRAEAFPDYVLEIGSEPRGPNPNVGVLQRMRFIGTSANTGLLHMNRKSHMWRLDELLFQSSPCPALVIDDCWDSNYTNIDILACGSSSDPEPSTGAAVIIRNESNNLYLRGLRVEHAPTGGLYIGEDCDPIYVVTGKLDQGFIEQHAAAVTVAAGGVLIMDDFNITGVSQRYVFDIRGSLLLGNVSIYGGTGMPAINDAREWAHVDRTASTGASGASFGPIIPNVHLGSSQFYRANLSSGRNTPSAVHSKIHPIRRAAHLYVIENGEARSDTIIVQIEPKPSADNLYDNCYLVHNPTGTHTGREPGARRKILTSFRDGRLLLQGNWVCTVDADWSIEFCGGHYTPNFAADGVLLEQGMSLFETVHSGLKIVDQPAYHDATSSIAAGATAFTVDGPDIRRGSDVAGYFLVDDTTGEPFYIDHGMSSSGRIAVLYDRVDTLNLSHTYCIVAGFAAGVSQSGGCLEWSFAGRRRRVSLAAAASLGFDINNIPLWGFDGCDGPVHLPNSNEIHLDESSGRHFVITVVDARPFSVNAPNGLSQGDRILITIRNVTNEAMGQVIWRGPFRMSQWINPAGRTSRSIELCSIGTELIEINRTPFDVPN